MIDIQPVGPGDEELFLGLVDALADYERLERPTAEARQRLVRDGFGEDPLFHAYLAGLDGEVVGYAIVLFTYSSFLARPTLYVEDLFVLPQARGSGVGKALLSFLAGEAVRRGCGRMEWVVLDWNQPAIDFYERLGARRLTEWYTYRLSGAELEAMAARGAGR